MSEPGEWHIEQAKFQGYVRAKLEENTTTHAVILSRMDDHDKRINKAENSITALNVKSGFLGVLGGLAFAVGKATIKFFTGA